MMGRSGCLERFGSFIRNLPAPAEFCLVLFIGFGLYIAGSIWMVIKSGRIEINNAGCCVILIGELLLLPTVLWIGKIRGWSPATFGFLASWKGTAAGVLLFIVAQLTMVGTGIGAQLLHPERPPFGVARLAIPLVLLVSIINPVFEEVLEAGYFIRSLQGFGMWPAVLAAALFRVTLHWWLGINAALSVFALGILFGLVYWRWRQLWPLVIAHWLCDMVGLLYVSHQSGLAMRLDVATLRTL
jgi:membrane protease YdiL (CAAX protease family)